MKNRYYVVAWTKSDVVYGENHEKDCRAYVQTMTKSEARKFRKESETFEGKMKIYELVEVKP